MMTVGIVAADIANVPGRSKKTPIFHDDDRSGQVVNSYHIHDLPLAATVAYNKPDYLKLTR